MVCIGPYNLSTGLGAETLETVGSSLLTDQLAHTPSDQMAGSRLALFSVYKVLVRMLCPLSSGVPGHLIHGFSEMVFNTPMFLYVPSPV